MQWPYKGPLKLCATVVRLCYSWWTHFAWCSAVSHLLFFHKVLCWRVVLFPWSATRSSSAPCCCWISPWFCNSTSQHLPGGIRVLLCPNTVCVSFLHKKYLTRFWNTKKYETTSVSHLSSASCFPIQVVVVSHLGSSWTHFQLYW